MMMKSSSLGLFLFLLLNSQMSVLRSAVRRYYKYFPDHFTWQDAQSHCRSLNRGTDLVTIYTQSDADILSVRRYYAWIGLRKKPISSSPPEYEWTWSNGQVNNFKVWAQHEPRYGRSCASVQYNSKRFYGTSCEESLFFICQKSNVSTHPYFSYTFIPQSKTWFEAEQYCREKFQDLATVSDHLSLNSAVDQQDFPVWIGLYRDGETWKWSSGMSEYRRWASGEPENNGSCVSISSSSNKMATQNCSARFPFGCFRDNLVLVKENKTWEEALEHCRALKSSSSSHISYELVSVEPGAEQNYVMNKVKEANTEKVWTGLRFLAGHWLWVNKENVLYSDLPICPLMGQHCGAFSKSDTGSVETTDCSQKLNFLCYSTDD